MLDSTSVVMLSDVWYFDVPSVVWIWVTGFSEPANYGNTGPQGLYAQTTLSREAVMTPGPRIGATVIGGTFAGTFYIFGGIKAYPGAPTMPDNDFWYFSSSADLAGGGPHWIWVAGGVEAPFNPSIPSPRAYSGVAADWFLNPVYIFSGYSDAAGTSTPPPPPPLK